MNIVIEVERGQYRIKNGKARQYAADYGYITETRGADNEPIDVYRGLFPNSKMAYIINQYHGGFFDEHKVMLDFYDKEQAINAYRLTTGNTPEIFSCTMQQLKWWLQFGNHAAPVTAQSFPFDNENEDMMTQDFNTNWTDKTAAQFIYEMRKTDEYGELTEAATLDAICFDEEQDGAQIEFQAAFDALAVENKRLEKTAQLLGLALNRTSGSLKVVENGIQISAPMKKNGTTNIAVMYEMTDGQTVSVLFHNPDTTPAKIAPDDVLISWKWLLNRKDITIVVAKENGKDLPLPIVARRVMALVEKNTARFAKANANKAAETEELARLESEKAQKLARLEELNQMVDAQNQSEIDINEIQTDINHYMQDDDKDLTLAVRRFVNTMRNKFINTAALGKVYFGKKSVGSLGKGTHDELRAKLVLHVPNTLKTGDYIGREALKYDRNDSFIAFHKFKGIAIIDGQEVEHIVKVGETPSGKYEFIAYYSRAAMDSIDEKNATFQLCSHLVNGVKDDKTSFNQTVPLNTYDVNATFDDIEDGKDGWNIEIISIRELDAPNHSGSLKTEPLDESALEPLNVPENATAKEVRKALETYLKQLQGKTITTSDGKTVRFSGKSTGHITNDIMQRENGLALQAAEFAVEVLKTGQFIERQELYKAREKDGFVAFHTYRKWVELKDGTKMNLQVKAGELQNGLLVAGDGLIAYAMKNAEKIKEAENNPTSFTGDSANDVSGISQLPHRPAVQVEPASTSQCNNHTAIYDAAQDNEPYIFIEILEVREKNSGSLNDGEPQEIDVSEIDTDLSKYQNADDESFKEAVGRVLNQLQGKYVNTQIGKVLFNAVSVGELKLGTKENKICASLIPFVPETLQNGTYLGKFELAKDRSGKKGKFVAFHNFGNTVVVDNKEINHVVKVGERENGEFVFIAYHSRAVMDSANEKETVSAPDTVSNIKAGRSEAETISMNAILRKKAYGVNGVFDDIEDGKDGWNIEIISIRELDSVETIEIENSTVPELVGENGNNPQSPIGLHGANEKNPTQTPPDSQDDVANRLKEKLSQIGFTEKNEDGRTKFAKSVQRKGEKNKIRNVCVEFLKNSLVLYIYDTNKNGAIVYEYNGGEMHSYSKVNEEDFIKTVEIYLDGKAVKTTDASFYGIGNTQKILEFLVELSDELEKVGIKPFDRIYPFGERRLQVERNGIYSVITPMSDNTKLKVEVSDENGKEEYIDVETIQEAVQDIDDYFKSFQERQLEQEKKRQSEAEKQKIYEYFDKGWFGDGDMEELKPLLDKYRNDYNMQDVIQRYETEYRNQNEDDQTSEDENVQKAREFANELIAKKYSLQQILDGEIDDKLDWLLYLDGGEYEDLAHDAMKAYAELF